LTTSWRPVIGLLFARLTSKYGYSTFPSIPVAVENQQYKTLQLQSNAKICAGGSSILYDSSLHAARNRSPKHPQILLNNKLWSPHHVRFRDTGPRSTTPLRDLCRACQDMDFANFKSTNHAMVASGVAHENATPQMNARVMSEHHSRPDISIVPFVSLLTDVCGLLEL
jgi:hypothetical protein